MEKNWFQNFCMQMKMQWEHLSLDMMVLAMGFWSIPLARGLLNEGHDSLERHVGKMAWPPMSKVQFYRNGELFQEMCLEMYRLGAQIREESDIDDLYQFNKKEYKQLCKDVIKRVSA